MWLRGKTKEDWTHGLLLVLDNNSALWKISHFNFVAQRLCAAILMAVNRISHRECVAFLEKSLFPYGLAKEEKETAI